MNIFWTDAIMKKAAVESYTKLVRGCNALDAVEGAVGYMESKKYFNCAWGGSLDVNGEVVMDAGIMDGSFNGASVGAVRDVEHPISLARMVMHETDHVLLVEKGAQNFALDMGVPVLPPGWLVPEPTPSPSIYSGGGEEGEEGSRSISRFGKYDPANYDDDRDSDWQTQPSKPSEEKPIKQENLAQCMAKFHESLELFEDESEGAIECEAIILEPTFLQVGAVGAVAFDRKGRLATGTSTAGFPGKPNGRISPVATVLGCGIFADHGGCASVSGNEESIYAYAPARKIVYRLNKGKDLEKSLNKELDNFEKEMFESNVGSVALNVDGKPCVDFRSVHFPWAYCELGYLYFGSQKGEHCTEKIEGLDRPENCMCEGVI